MTCENCDCLAYGDVVEHVMNTNIFGVVIGFQGSLVGIRTSPSLRTLWFHDYELRALADDEYWPGAAEDIPTGGNVINFTEAVALRRDTETKGAA